MWGRTPSVVRDNSSARAGERFAARRRLRRRRALIASVILILLLLGALVYAANQDFMRISTVQVFGAEPSLAQFAEDRMQGTYFGIIPRNSTLFYPAALIRADILATRRDIAAVSFSRKGLTGLSITVIERVPIARWCGLAPTPDVEAYCYVFDASGFIYAAAASSTPTLNTFTLYAPLASATEDPLGATLPSVHTFPSAFDFAREVGTLGSPVVAVVYRDSEVDDYLASGTRITYVLGNEQNAFTALTSAKGDLNLTDGSLEYVDLRFDGKVYLRKKGDTVQK